MSLGVNLLAALVASASPQALGEDFDIEIVEMHHRTKVDAPSGTALLLGEAAAEGRGIALDDHSVRGRDGHTGARASPATSASRRCAAARSSATTASSSPAPASASSSPTRPRTARIFARGAVKAALWGRGRKPGLYSHGRRARASTTDA